MNALLRWIGEDPTLVYAIVSLALIAAVFIVAWLIKAEADSPVRSAKRRAGNLNERYRAAPALIGGAVTVKRHGRDSSFAIIDRLVKAALPRPGLLRGRLEKTGLPLSIGEYFLLCVVTGLVLTGLTFHFVGLSFALCLAIGVASAICVPHFGIGYLIARRRAKFIANFPEAIELIVRGLKSGLPIGESIKTVATEIPNPVGIEFASIANNIKLGRTIDEAMWVAARRIDTPEFKFFVISLSVQKETGGNLAETLENLADILRKRRQMKLKVKALSSEARASAYIIGALPFIMFGIIYFLNRGYVMELFNDPRGHIMLLVGGIMLLMGIGTMAKMVRFEI